MEVRMVRMSGNGREFEKKNERWKIIICRGRVENGREFELEEKKMEEIERKMEESLRRKSGSWPRLLQYLRRQRGRWKGV